MKMKRKQKVQPLNLNLFMNLQNFTELLRRARALRKQLLVGVFSFFFLAFALVEAANEPVLCEANFIEDLQEVPELEQSFEMALRLENFAKEHNLPVKAVSVGPEETRVRRIIVPIDFTNAPLLKAYREAFNLETRVSEIVAGTMAIEIQSDARGMTYNTIGMRTGSTANSSLFRDASYTCNLSKWWSNEWFFNNRGAMLSAFKGIRGFGHLFPLNEAELKNVRHYLANPGQRGTLKTVNCAAWASSVELGVTKAGASLEERRHLFTELGMSRSIEHTEIGRRLVHAANQKHVAMVAFVDGAEGLKSFENIDQRLPPLTKIPLAQVIKDDRKELQNKRLVELKETFSELVPDGARIFFPIASGSSPLAFEALASMANDPKLGLQMGYDVHLLVNGLSQNLIQKAKDNDPNNKFKISALFLGGNLRKLYHEGKVDLIPGYLADFPRMVRDKNNADFDYDVIVIRVSPANRNGIHSLGPNADMIATILEANPGVKVIAEVNKNIPRTKGVATQVPGSRIDVLFEDDSPLGGPAKLPLTRIEEEIGKGIAELIPSGAYMQLGIGNVFDGIPAAMARAGTQRIKIFTEMFGDPLMHLVKKNVVTSAQTGFAFGSEDLYKWLDGNKKVEMIPTERSNDPVNIIAKNKFHAVNTALQVTLRGDVNATHAPNGRISSPGGQVEFMSSAIRFKWGKAIIAIRSTAKGGTISSISLETYGGNVTTPHESVTHVVTEYGTALLQGKSVVERAIAMINVAHPKFRGELFRGAVERGILQHSDQELIDFKQLEIVVDH